MSGEGNPDWTRACTALSLLATDPSGLGGIVLQSRVCPVRDRFLEIFEGLFPSVRIHPAMEREALFGGVDLAALLSSGRMVLTTGLLARASCLTLVMAERCSAGRAAELAQRLDAHGGAMLALDEGADADEAAPFALTERLAFHLSLDGIRLAEAAAPDISGIEAAQRRLADVIVTVDAVRALAALAVRLGIASLRPPVFALRAAIAHAALRQADRVEDADVEMAAGLVLAPRAESLPVETDERESHGQDPKTRDNGSQEGDSLKIPDEILVEAVRPHLPSDLLEGVHVSRRTRGAKGTGSGRKTRSNRRGRPLPSTPGRPSGGDRVDVTATLRAAAPWQSLRGRTGPVRILSSDIRLKRYEEKSDRLLIFAVDASGSAAMARLGDAKGAVEVMLAQAYASRDMVALIAFRGDRADLLLPPTRSLVQAKRRLTALPGGGGTPLATGLKAAGELARHAQGQGMTPVLLLLTDGRANIALNGSPGRKQAGEDVSVMARWLRDSGLPGIVLDTGNRPGPLAALAQELAAQYLPLPRADSASVGKALNHAIRNGLDT